MKWGASGSDTFRFLVFVMVYGAVMQFYVGAVPSFGGGSSSAAGQALSDDIAKIKSMIYVAKDWSDIVNTLGKLRAIGAAYDINTLDQEMSGAAVQDLNLALLALHSKILSIPGPAGQMSVLSMLGDLDKLRVTFKCETLSPFVETYSKMLMQSAMLAQDPTTAMTMMMMMGGGASSSTNLLALSTLGGATGTSGLGTAMALGGMSAGMTTDLSNPLSQIKGESLPHFSTIQEAEQVMTKTLATLDSAEQTLQASFFQRSSVSDEYVSQYAGAVDSIAKAISQTNKLIDFAKAAEYQVMGQLQGALAGRTGTQKSFVVDERIYNLLKSTVLSAIENAGLKWYEVTEVAKGAASGASSNPVFLAVDKLVSALEGDESTKVYDKIFASVDDRSKFDVALTKAEQKLGGVIGTGLPAICRKINGPGFWNNKDWGNTRLKSIVLDGMNELTAYIRSRSQDGMWLRFETRVDDIAKAVLKAHTNLEWTKLAWLATPAWSNWNDKYLYDGLIDLDLACMDRFDLMLTFQQYKDDKSGRTVYDVVLSSLPEAIDSSMRGLFAAEDTQDFFDVLVKYYQDDMQDAATLTLMRDGRQANDSSAIVNPSDLAYAGMGIFQTRGALGARKNIYRPFFDNAMVEFAKLYRRFAVHEYAEYQAAQKEQQLSLKITVKHKSNPSMKCIGQMLLALLARLWDIGSFGMDHPADFNDTSYYANLAGLLKFVNGSDQQLTDDEKAMLSWTFVNKIPVSLNLSGIKASTLESKFCSRDNVGKYLSLAAAEAEKAKTQVTAYGPLAAGLLVRLPTPSQLYNRGRIAELNKGTATAVSGGEQAAPDATTK